MHTWTVAFKRPDARSCVSFASSGSWSAADNIDAWVRGALGSSALLDSHWLMYNDEPAGGAMAASSSCGHCKGVLLWGTAGGGAARWLVHSVPKWPSPEGEAVGRIPESECIYGQSFACVNVDADRVPEVMAHLHLMQAHVYATSSAEAEALYASAAKGLPTHELHIIHNLVPGVSHCAKHGLWGRDLFEDGLVPGPFAGRSCLAETWMRPHEPSTEHVHNVLRVAWRCCGDATEYRGNQDHSKWAVVQDADTPRVFIGDINRMASQHHRGGGGFVFSDPRLWQGVSEAVATVETRA